MPEIAWSVCCSISFGGVFFLFVIPVQHLMRMWRRSVGGPGIYERRRSFASPIAQINHGEVLFTSATRSAFVNVRSRRRVCLRRSRQREQFSTVSPTEWSKSSVYLLSVFSLWLQTDYFDRAFFQFVSIELGLFIAGFSILLFRADHCCESVFAHSFRFFQVRREAELSVFARGVISRHKSGWFRSDKPP